MAAKLKKRGGGGGATENGDKAAGVDELALASAISNGEDLGPIIRSAFEAGKPEALVHQLRAFAKKKEGEIEDLCKLHYEEFIRAVDELRGVLVDADELKVGLASQNSQMQGVGHALLAKLDELIESYTVRRNLAECTDALLVCISAVRLCTKCNEHMGKGGYYPALKALDAIERDCLPKLPARALRTIIERQIPISRSYVEKRAVKEFHDWLVQIRTAERDVGQQSIGQASSARKREEELRGRQREAEEQSRSSFLLSSSVVAKDCVYMLEAEDHDEDDAVLKFDLTPLYRAHYIHACLGLQEQFRNYYYKNRLLQLNSDLQTSSTQSFLELHQTYFAQIAGFFIVEDRVLRTAGGLISRLQVESLWETAVAKIISVLDDQFLRIQTANHLLVVKDYVSLLAATLRRYGYVDTPLLSVLDRNRDKYHELLLSDCRKRIIDAFTNDKYEQMVIRREYEYRSSVLAFRLQVSDTVPAFPYVAPFSASVPDCCRVVKSFVEDSVSFLSHGGSADLYDAARKYLDRLLSGVLNEAVTKLVWASSNRSVSHAMQIAANVTSLEHCCEFFAQHTAHLCGIPIRLVDRTATLATKSSLAASRSAAHDKMLALVKSKVDEFMQLTDHIHWTPDEPPQHGNEYLNELIIYLDTLVSTAQQILPADVLAGVVPGVLRHISNSIVDAFLADSMRRFNINAVIGIDADLRLLESFADDKYQSCGLKDLPNSTDLKYCLIEARQLVNLLISHQPELYLNPVIREKNYSALDYKKLIIIAEKYRDLPEKLFGTRNPKHVSKKRSMDALIRRLRDT